MAARITDEEWDKLSPENFETHSLLRAVDAVDELRDDLNDGEYATPPQLRTDLLKLNQLAMAVINEGSRSQVAILAQWETGADGIREEYAQPPGWMGKVEVHADHKGRNPQEPDTR